MNVASLYLCKELYELSGWEAGLEQDRYWVSDTLTHRAYLKTRDVEGAINIPAYDLGYLLRKLDGHVTLTNEWAAGGWRAIFKKTGDMYEGPKSVEIGDTPEDAVARLTIKLFKQKILTKGKTDNE